MTSSRTSVDLSFHDDSEGGVVEHVFAADAERMLEDIRTERNSATFDARRLRLDYKPARWEVMACTA